MSSNRKRFLDDEPSRSIEGKRHRYRSRSPQRRPAADPRRPTFPSYIDTPNLPQKIHLLCEIIASSPSLEISLNDSGTTVSSDDIEEVLKLSYSHPASAVKFFRWSGTRIQHQHSPYSWNLVVDLLGKNFLFDAMWDAVSSMKSEGLVSLATFASIFSSFAAAGRPDDAAAAFESLPHHGIPHDTTALNSLLSALSREGLTFNALTSMRHIRLRIPPDSDSYAILLEGFENERNYPRTREVFDDMIMRIGWDRRNVPAFDSFLNTVLSCGDRGLDEALGWLSIMKEHMCFPGLKFIHNAIDECVKINDERVAILLWDSLVGKYGWLPDTELYNSMLTLYCNLNQLDAAYQLFDEMVFYGGFPNSKTYNLMLQLAVNCKKLQDVHLLFKEMVKNEFMPDLAICNSAMNLLLDYRDWDTATKVWKIMIENGIAGEEVGNLLVGRLQYHKLLPEACKYAEGMIDKGIKLHSSTLSKLRSSLHQMGKSPMYDEILSKWKKASSERSL